MEFKHHSAVIIRIILGIVAGCLGLLRCTPDKLHKSSFKMPVDVLWGRLVTVTVYMDGLSNLGREVTAATGRCLGALRMKNCCWLNDEESQEYSSWRLLNAASQLFQLSVLGFSFQLRNCFLFPLLYASGFVSQALVEVIGWANGLECWRF